MEDTKPGLQKSNKGDRKRLQNSTTRPRINAFKWKYDFKGHWAYTVLSLSLPSILTALLFICSFQFVSLPAHQESLLAEKKSIIKDMTNALWMLVSHYEGRERSGELSRAEAQQRVALRIAAIRYGKSGLDYFWISNMEGEVLMHPFIHDFKNRYPHGIVDTTGSPFLTKAARIVREKNAGYLQYQWQHYHYQNDIGEKISYVRGFKPWGWILGTGIYLDQIEKETEIEIRNLQQFHTIIFIIVAALSAYIAWRRNRDEFQRQLMEKKLVQSENRYRTLVETSSDIVWETDRRGIVTYVSPRVFPLLGYHPQDINGQSILRRIQEKNRAEILAIFRPVSRHQEAVTSFETEIIHRDGSRRILESNCNPVLNHDGSLAGFRGISRDITERKKTEVMLAQLRNQLDAIFNAMPSVLISINADLEVVRWNKPAAEMAALTLDLNHRYGLVDVFPLLKDNLSSIQDVITLQKPDVLQELPWKKGDNKRYMDVMVYPLYTEKVEGAVIRIDDVTQRVNMTEVMIQSEKMISLGGLVAGIAHEINNPLGIILNGTQTLKQRLSPDLKNNQVYALKAGINLKNLQGYLQERKILFLMQGIVDSALRAADIIKNLLLFSRKQESVKLQANLPEIIEDALQMVSADWDIQKKYDFRSVEILRNYDSDLPPILCNRSEITQVLINIFKNAAHAMGDHDENSPSLIRIGARRDGDMALLQIEDNGTGMSAEVRRRVFDPFYTTKPVGSGTGLGLSVSYLIITRIHRGEIAVTSEPGDGTCFTIRLPFKNNT